MKPCQLPNAFLFSPITSLFSDTALPYFSAWPCLQMTTKLPGGCHKGELTLLGQRQALSFGQWLRRRYCDNFGLLEAEFQVVHLLSGGYSSQQRPFLRHCITSLVWLTH